MTHAYAIAPAPRHTIERFFAREGSTPLADAFDRRRGVHPFIGLSPVPDEDVETTWQSLQGQTRRGKSVAYLHIPYCVGRCAFCGFYQSRWNKDEGPAYVDAMIEQLRQDRDAPYQAAGPIQAVYFGGGTPTLLATRDLVRLIEAVRVHLPLSADCEITVEGRAHGFDIDKAQAAFTAGANRLSLGVQSFEEALRRRLGRRTPRRTLIGFLERLMAADQAAIVIDLIFGLPDQDLRVWEQDVRNAIQIGLDGADLYALRLVPNSPLAARARSGQLRLASADNHGVYYARGAELMDAARWELLSNSHWRRSTCERNLYNLEIKGGASCLAFGAGAGGFLDGCSYRLVPEPEEYRRRIARGLSPVAQLMRHSPYHRLFNLIKAGMERGHLDSARLAVVLAESTGLDLDALAGPLFAQWQRAGLLTRDGDWLDLTQAGRFWQVTMTQSLLEWLHQCIGDQQARSAAEAVDAGA